MNVKKVCRFCEVNLTPIKNAQVNLWFCPKCHLIYFFYTIELSEGVTPTSSFKDEQANDTLSGLSALFEVE